MNRIVIREEDLTLPGVSASPTDIAYVPGFSVNASAAEASFFEPTLCSTVDEFVSVFGSEPFKFSLTDNDTIEFGDTGSMVFKNGDEDKSYIYAYNLLKAGIPVIYHVLKKTSGDDFSPCVKPSELYAKLGPAVEQMLDAGEFQVKYLTSGAYPVFEQGGSPTLTGKYVTVAKTRGDCIALIDHCGDNNIKLNTTDTNSIYKTVNSTSYRNVVNEFSAMFTPWCEFSDGYVMPASFAYLISLAKSIETNNNWLAIAGVTRGKVPGLTALFTTERLSNAYADAYQDRTGISINAITNIKPYGYCIWGNRTMKNNAENLTATSFLNTRNMVSEIKKLAYETAKKLLFEQNSAVLWVNFVSGMQSYLDKLRSGQGISGYKIIKGTTSEKAKLVATIKIYPLYAVENFDITIQMSDDEVSIS